MNGPEENRNIGKQDMSEQQHAAEADDGMSAADVQFEVALARAIRRVDVRDELSQKLLALAEEAHGKQRTSGGGWKLLKLSSAGRLLMFPQQRAWLGGAIAAVLALGVFIGSHSYHEHERRVEAQRQFETAERITDQTLEHTREQLREAGITLGQ